MEPQRSLLGPPPGPPSLLLQPPPYLPAISTPQRHVHATGTNPFINPVSANLPNLPTAQATAAALQNMQNIQIRKMLNIPGTFESMEVVWHGEFDRLFSQYIPQQWFLLPTYQPPKAVVPWNVFTDSAKVRFSCSNCGHGWTSMKGRVAFWFHLDTAANTGCVLFKLYGQQCQKCQPEEFEHAMWYPEEVSKVISNIYHRVGQVYYGFYIAPIRIDRRGGKPRNQHNKELCQACKDGVCREWSASA